MTNTNKKTSRRISRTFGALLAAVMMMSTAASFAASAADTNTVVKMNTAAAAAKANVLDPTFTLNGDLLKTKNVTTSTIFKVLEGTTEYGKYFTPALSFITDLVFGPQKDPTQQKLDDINDKIDKLFARIDTLQDELVSSFGNQLGIQNFYDKFVSFKSQIQNMRRKINEISVDTSLTQLDKIAKIGSLAGSYNEWDVKFENVQGQLDELISKPSFTQNCSIFELTYNHFCGESMFSGEAIDKAKPLCDSLMQVYIAGAVTITECLAAQYYVSQLPDEYKDKVSSEYMSHICQSADDIVGEIKSVNAHIANQNQKIVYLEGKAVKCFNSLFNDSTFPADSDVKRFESIDPAQCYYYISYYFQPGIKSIEKVEPVFYTDSEAAALRTDTKLFNEMYNAVFDRSGSILVNKNSKGNGYQVSDKLNWNNHSDNPHCTNRYSDRTSYFTQQWFNDAAGNNQISFSDIKMIADYCRSKGISIRSLLNSAGINTSSVPQNANIVTSKAIDGSNSEADRMFKGVYYEKTYYMGINIDAVGAGEKKYQLVDCGWNAWKGQEEWNYAPDGAFCWLTKQ